MRGDGACGARWGPSLRILAGFLLWPCVAAEPGRRSLSFEERLADRVRIEQVYQRHRTWPEGNAGARPDPARLRPRDVRVSVERELRKSAALAEHWHDPITSAQLSAEMARMARSTRDPALLRELFAALGDDPLRIAEGLARRRLASRRFARAYAREAHGQPATSAEAWLARLPLADGWREPVLDGPLPERPPVVTGGGSDFHGAPPDPRDDVTAVWTGTEMIVWGGRQYCATPCTGTGGRYDPATDSWRTTAETGAPEARYDHTAVWTGSEMIVWGGDAYGVPSFADGGRYDPVQDRWTPLTTVGAPAGRYWHTAVWTGSRMVVWGGFGATGYASGGRYDPTTDSWSPTSMSGVPEARGYHTAAWTGTEVIVWGGFAYGGGADLDTGGRYDPALDRWRATSTTGAPSGRQQHAAVWTGSRMVVFGGRRGYQYLADGSRYDPQTDTWAAVAATSIYLAGAGRIAAWTGSEVLIPWSSGGGGRYDPVLDSWRRMSNVGQPLLGDTSVWTGRELIVWGLSVAGGIYDPVVDAWRPTSFGDLPPARAGHAAAWTGAEVIFWGGSVPQGPVDVGERYDPATDAWIETAPNPAVGSASYGCTMVWTGSQLVSWGGFYGLDTPQLYDPVSDSWRSGAGTSGLAWDGHSTVWTGREMIVFGGGSSTANGGAYDPVADRWRAIATSQAPSGRRDHVAVWTGTEMIVWGGRTFDIYGREIPLCDGGRYEPVADRWRPLAVVGAPLPLWVYRGAWTGTELVVLGDDGGRYDPGTDSWRGIAEPPICFLGSRDARAVWTGQEVILWGGFQWDCSPSERVAAYDPASDSWRSGSAVDAPSVRRQHAMAWTGTEVVVWGGEDNQWRVYNSGGRYDPARDVWSDGPAGGCAAPNLSPTTLPGGLKGVGYSLALAATGGNPPYTFSVGGGALPPGLSLSAGGAITGYPAAAGVFGFEAVATDATGCAGRRGYRITICEPMALAPSVLPDGIQGQTYYQTFALSGGIAPVSTEVVAGSLPPDTGYYALRIGGTPRVRGPFAFTVAMRDVGGCESRQSFSIKVCGDVALQPPSPPVGRVGDPYLVDLVATRGATPYDFAVVAGGLPPGVSLSAAGRLAGTPTTAGAFGFDLRVNDGDGCDTVFPYGIDVNAAGCPTIALAPVELPRGRLGAAYGATITATGAPPVTFDVTSGALPPGLRLSSQGVVSGTPTAAVSNPFAVTATDAAGCRGSRVYDVAFGDDYFVGAGSAYPNLNRVRLLRAGLYETGTDFLAYGASHWGVHVAAADVDGGWDELLTGPGPGPVLGPTVHGYRRESTPMGKINFYAYGTLKYGVKVGGASVDIDAYGEILTAPGPGAVFGPHVRGFDFDASAIAAIAKINFYAYGTLKYGAEAGGGDVDGDGYAEILTGPGPGPAFAPLVRGWNYDGASLAPMGKISFWAFPTPKYGAGVAGGDVDADGFDEIAAAPGAGAGMAARYRGFDFDARAVAQAPGFDVTAFTTEYGGRVALGDGTADGRDDLMAAPGPDPNAYSFVYTYRYDGTALARADTGSAFVPGFYGTNVAAADTAY